MSNFYKINSYIISKISKKSMSDIFISYKEQKDILEKIYKKILKIIIFREIIISIGDEE